MSKKKIKIGVTNNTGIISYFWSILKKKLNKKYILDVHILDKYSIDSNDLERNQMFIDEMKTKNYDMLIGDFLISSERYSEVNFTFPLYFITPRIAFIPKDNNKFEYLLYIKYLISGWIKPLSVLILVGFIIRCH